MSPPAASISLGNRPFFSEASTGLLSHQMSLLVQPLPGVQRMMMIIMKQAIVIAAVSLAAVPLWLVPQNAASAQAALQYKIGDRVAAPIGAQYFDWLSSKSFQNPPSYRVHPLGFLATADFTANPQMLHALGTVPIEPWGGIANDPYLVAAQGRAAQRPALPQQAQNAPRQNAVEMPAARPRPLSVPGRERNDCWVQFHDRRRRRLHHHYWAARDLHFRGRIRKGHISRRPPAGRLSGDLSSWPPA